jgi:hypothetical protein
VAGKVERFAEAEGRHDGSLWPGTENGLWVRSFSDTDTLLESANIFCKVPRGAYETPRLLEARWSARRRELSVRLQK